MACVKGYEKRLLLFLLSQTPNQAGLVLPGWVLKIKGVVSDFYTRTLVILGKVLVTFQQLSLICKSGGWGGDNVSINIQPIRIGGVSTFLSVMLSESSLTFMSIQAL